jgi:hypothetical protein
MGSFGGNRFRTRGAFQETRFRPFCPASRDSAAAGTGSSFPCLGTPKRVILGGATAEFLLLIFSKMMGDVKKAVAYPHDSGLLAVAIGGFMSLPLHCRGGR